MGNHTVTQQTFQLTLIYSTTKVSPKIEPKAHHNMTLEIRFNCNINPNTLTFGRVPTTAIT